MDADRNASCTVDGHDGYPARNCPGCRVDRLLVEAEDGRTKAAAEIRASHYHRKDDE